MDVFIAMPAPTTNTSVSTPVSISRQKIFVKEDAPALFRDFLGRAKRGDRSRSSCRGRHGLLPTGGARLSSDPGLPRGSGRAASTAGPHHQECPDSPRPGFAPRSCVTENLVHVTLIVITTLDAALARVMEPRHQHAGRSVAGEQALAEAGVPVRVFVAPGIPGLTDSEMPAILAAAKAAGATRRAIPCCAGR